jgi:RNA polymerase sigma-70 factor, ECF subfamily
MEVGEFGKLLEKQIPRLQRCARALRRQSSRRCAPGSLRSSTTNVNDVRSGIREGIAMPVEDVAEKLSEPASQGSSLDLRDLDQAMARMAQEQRQVVLLVGLDGLGYEEVAKILDVPIGTVRSRLSRAREALRDWLGREQPRAAA